MVQPHFVPEERSFNVVTRDNLWRIPNKISPTVGQATLLAKVKLDKTLDLMCQASRHFMVIGDQKFLKIMEK